MSDPYLILGVGPDADDACVQAAYLAGIKSYPPDRDPHRFQDLRAAYEAVRTRRQRLSHALFDHSAPTLVEILDRLAPVGESRRPDAALFSTLLKGNT